MPKASIPNPIFVYITSPSRQDADKLAKTLVEQRLAACVNIIPGMDSIYRWRGKIKTAKEVVLIAKTQARLFARLEKSIKELHTYECPCIVALSVVKGHQPYLDWIAAETQSQKGKRNGHR